MCQVHATWAVLRNVPHNQQREVADQLPEAYGNEQRLQTLADGLNGRGYRRAANTIKRFLPGLLSYSAFPKPHHKRIRTTNGMERISKELKRRTKVIWAMPNEASPLRLAGAILMDINEEGITGRRYLPTEEESSPKETGTPILQKDRDATLENWSLGGCMLILRKFLGYP